MGVGEFLTAGGLAVGVIVWLVRMEGRLNGVQQAHEEHVKTNDREHAQHHKRHEEMRDDITYIRERIDRALNGRDR
jgi:hypothetical protein